MKSYIFSIVIEEDSFPDGGRAYHAFCPALKGCHTWGHSSGNTSGETLVIIQEAIELYVEDLLESGETIQVDPDLGVVELDTPSVVVNV
ncbi:MAG: type II toxin-antitoxin system HicB family antitoxin [Chloroflexi bacterium]|nr:type II toxin-antitoxin system HicB family antitoxin [Chloroflexota bacterium]